MVPLSVRNRILRAGYRRMSAWSRIDDDRCCWMSYQKKQDEVYLITAAPTTGKWIIEVLKSVEIFEAE